MAPASDYIDKGCTRWYIEVMNIVAKQPGHIVVIIGIVVVVVGALGVVFASQYVRVQSEKDRLSSQTTASQEKAGQIERDTVRQQHAVSIAAGLVSHVLIAKNDITPNQAGLELIANNGDESLRDPSTNQSYVFGETQDTMKVGEATFRTSATCDNKVASSGGTGLIVGASTNSVAVAIKLESGEYACQTNL